VDTLDGTTARLCGVAVARPIHARELHAHAAHGGAAMFVAIALFVLFGFVVGLVARLFVGGPRGFWETSGVGMAGAVIGGFVARALGWLRTPWSPRGFLVALLGAILLIVVARGVRGRSTAL
jgi:uncharacterized membrane protein YeaQ/YmgE (transglycosylase-associated protein family)